MLGVELANLQKASKDESKLVVVEARVSALEQAYRGLGLLADDEIDELYNGYSKE